jgi:hypothetical protein
LVAALTVVLVAGPGGAVIGGTTDTDNRYANVGVLQLNVDGEWVDLCTGTLVDADVVLTAAHRTDFLIEEGETASALTTCGSPSTRRVTPPPTRWTTSWCIPTG